MTCAVHAVILLAAMLAVTSLLQETEPHIISYECKSRGLMRELRLLLAWSRLDGVEIKEHAQKKE